MTLSQVRTNLGYFLIAIGLVMMLVGIITRKSLWAGYRTKQVQVIVTKDAKAKPADKSSDGQHYTGDLRIEAVYELTGSHLPSGEIQVRDSNNQIWMLRLCSIADNGVLPVFKIGTTVNILYTDGNDCRNFINAQVIKEDK